MIVIAILVGAITALFAALLHLLVDGCNDVAVQITELTESFPMRLLVIFFLPMLGIFISYFIQRHWCNEGFEKSLAPLILKLDRQRENIPLSETLTHIFTSAFAVGFGGSAGLEAPSVLTGAAIGSNVARFFLIQRMPRSVIVSCGAAAAISAIFDSPIAGVLFVAEALMPEFTVSALIPPLISSAVSNMVSACFHHGNGPFFMEQISEWHGSEVLIMFACGAVCALVGAFIIQSTASVGQKLRRIANPDTRFILGALCTCAILFCFPFLRSQGYGSIEQLLLKDDSLLSETPFVLSWVQDLPMPLIILAAAIFLKPIVSSLTIESGGDGGIFAPSMFIGAFTGFAVARFVNYTGLAQVSEPNFAALGMCGVFTTVMRAPLAGIFLIAETTGGYGLLVPLMIVSAVAWTLGKVFEPHSIYKKSLIAKGLISDDLMEAQLKRVPLTNCIRTFAVSFPLDMPIQQALETIQKAQYAQRNFPVLNPDHTLAGFLDMETLFTAVMGHKDLKHKNMGELMTAPAGTIRDNDTLDSAMANMHDASLTFVPVIDHKNGSFLGIVSKDTILDHIRGRA